jgi:putative heme iron utilization protein
VAETGDKSGPEDDNAVVTQARRLLRAARAGTLATVTGKPGEPQPFASLITSACAPDLSILVFLSTLSEHTRHLAAEPRCAVLVQGERAGANPQMTPRVTVTGRAERCDDALLKARWLAVHPYAAMYAGFADFGLWRIVPQAASLIGGFARAYRLGAVKLLPDPVAVQAMADAEAGIIAQCNHDHARAIDRLAQQGGGFSESGWRMIAADCDGCDLALDEITWRCAWLAPVVDAEGARKAPINLLEALREPPG